MKVNVTKVIVDLEGEPLKNPKGKPATVRWACCEALLSKAQNEQRQVDGEEKVKRFKLAQRIAMTDEPDLSIEELALVRQLVALGFDSNLVVGQVWEALAEQKQEAAK